MTPRTLVIDIETAPIEAYVWGLFDNNVALNQIKTEWSILSYAAKWLDEKQVHYDDTSGRGARKVRDDKKLMRGLWELLDEADIVVGQNHKKFDLKKIHARMVEHGYKPYSPIRVVDTTIEARRYFGFTSKKLEWMSKHLTDCPKDSHKEFPGFELWTECLVDNPRAWREMKKYNIRDVEATEKVYRRLLPWIATHPNAAVHIQDKEPRCPKCSSKDLQRRGFALTQQGSYPRWQCNECGGWARGKTTTLHHSVRKNLLVGA
jgi:DNA polymerase elongation subunit (family B)/ribosomal protein L37AE/L43A